MTAQNWPDPKRPGVPMFPERDGWHWIHTGNGSGPRPFYWCSKAQGYFTSPEVWAHRWKYTKVWEYHGPVFTPTQINEILAAERERCAETLNRAARDTVKFAKRTRTDIESSVDYQRMIEIAATQKKDAEVIRNLGAAP